MDYNLIYILMEKKTQTLQKEELCLVIYVDLNVGHYGYLIDSSADMTDRSVQDVEFHGQDFMNLMIMTFLSVIPLMNGYRFAPTISK